MTKIAFIGAGSLGFTAGLVRDVLTFPLLEDAQIALMDIDAERLDFAHKTVLKLVQAGEYPARVSASLDRVEALRDAWRNKKATSEELWHYAKVCRVLNVMRPYFDSLA